MRRKSDIPLTKHTLNLFEGDWNKLRAMYGRAGASRIIREVTRAFINKVEARVTVPSIEDIDVEIGI